MHEIGEKCSEWFDTSLNNNGTIQVTCQSQTNITELGLLNFQHFLENKELFNITDQEKTNKVVLLENFCIK